MLKKINTIFSESTNADSMGNEFRKKRMIFFKNIINQLPKPLYILDVGGYEIFWENIGFQNNEEVKIVLLNLTKEETKSRNISSVIGDATDLSVYKKNSFDIVFSNSVIEHLYTQENQKKMADEVMRVGKYHFIQTPNKHFFIEPHYILPYFQFVPKTFKYFILTKTKLSRMRYWDKDIAKQYIQEIRLLSLNEMKKLFPKSQIWKEFFLGMNKSYIAHNIKIKLPEK